MKQKLSRSVAFVLTFVMALSLLTVTSVLGEIPEGPEHRQTLIGLELVEVGPTESGGTHVDIFINLLANPEPGIFSLPGFMMPGRLNAAGEFIWNENIATLLPGSGANGGILWSPPGSVLADLFPRPAIVHNRCWQRTVFQTHDLDDPYTYYGPLIRLRYYVPADSGTVIFRYGPNPAMAIRYDILPYVRFGDGGYINVDFDWHVDVVFEAGGTGPVDVYHPVTFAPGEHGTIATGATVDIREGTAITAAQVPEVTAATGFRHTGWDTTPVGHIVTGAVTFTATFEADSVDPVDHVVTFAPGEHGTIAAGATVSIREGTAITSADVPEVVAATGFRHTGWDTVPVGHIVTGAVTFTATFEPETTPPVRHVVTFDTVGNGTLTDGEDLSIDDGAILPAIPTPVPAPGYRFVNWTPSDPATTPITGPITFTANFAVDTPPAARVIGDVNGDGVINDLDLTYIRTHITFYPGVDILGENGFFADINGDGTVTLADLMILRDFIYSYAEANGTREVSTATAISDRITHHRNIGQTAHR